MRFILICLILISLPAFAVDVVGDVVAGVTDCRVYQDGTDVGLVPAANFECIYNIDQLGNGSHTFTMTAIINDPIFGLQESAESIPLSFVKPGPPPVPGTPKLRK